MGFHYILNPPRKEVSHVCRYKRRRDLLEGVVTKTSVYCVTSLDIEYKDRQKPIITSCVLMYATFISAPLLLGLFYGTCIYFEYKLTTVV